MSIVADAIRPFWIKGMNDITGKLIKDFPAWICDEEYQIFDPIHSSSFKLNIASPAKLLAAFAYDCSRMASASFESVCTLKKDSTMPKSTAWFLLRSYYSAFFAAHSILRILGISCSQLSSPQSASINKIAELYNNALGIRPSKGFYVCEFNSSDKQLTCNKTTISAGGVHEAFWHTFTQRMSQLSDQILQTNGSTIINQQVATKLNELCLNLSYQHCNNGSWLSFVRNEINYKHKLGCWFPYNGYKAHYEELFRRVNEWHADPININLNSSYNSDLQRFQATCHFIISLCRCLVIDMSERCSTGKSFLSYGAISFLNYLKQ